MIEPCKIQQNIQTKNILIYFFIFLTFHFNINFEILSSLSHIQIVYVFISIFSLLDCIYLLFVSRFIPLTFI